MPGPRQIQNELVQDESSVLVLPGHQTFGYSDGAASEKYLEEVFRKAKDLRAGSSELEGYIKDWASEYHLTAKRAQLLSGFRFDRTMKVLEVGCGCGAITRFLGETFDHVTSVEGSLHRARLARLRTRDLTGVTVVCAPFQELRFAEKFDLIVCVGVFEYSAAFVEGPDPYDAVLRYFSELLAPDGVVLVAIENQFGLKYFASSREDHLGTMFEGIEGYRAHPGRVRTFGKVELQRILQRHFPRVDFYHPYPDYKLPDCVLSEDFLSSGYAGELVSQQRSRDYAGDRPALWDEALAVLELARNRMLPFFSNSFLVLAGKGQMNRITFDQQAILFSSPHRRRFRTRTRVIEEPKGRLAATKVPLEDPHGVDGGALRLVPTTSPWKDGHSLQTILYLASRDRKADLEAIFGPARGWVDFLRQNARERDGVQYLDGEFVDCIWSNLYLGPSGWEFVDREWVWATEVPLGAVVIRAIYTFLTKIEEAAGGSSALALRGGRDAIRSIAEVLGAGIDDADFARFLALEVKFQSIAYGLDEKRYRTYLRWFLADRKSLRGFRQGKDRLLHAASRVRAGLAKLGSAGKR